MLMSEEEEEPRFSKLDHSLGSGRSSRVDICQAGTLLYFYVLLLSVV